ncbi:hypothetical protein [Bradyrhizobium sp.]|uniref:hypothetical protein n=1 Tax=Bradyrhizobium sp. TaxID=376 RepID=UPI003BB14964
MYRWLIVLCLLASPAHAAGGIGGDKSYDVSCPEHQILVGFIARSGDLVDSFRMICSKVFKIAPNVCVPKT